MCHVPSELVTKESAPNEHNRFFLKRNYVCNTWFWLWMWLEAVIRILKWCSTKSFAWNWSCDLHHSWHHIIESQHSENEWIWQQTTTCIPQCTLTLGINGRKPKNVALHKPVGYWIELYCAPNAEHKNNMCKLCSIIPEYVLFSPIFLMKTISCVCFFLYIFFNSEFFRRFGPKELQTTYIRTCTYHQRYRHISNEINKKNEIINQYFLFGAGVAVVAATISIASF